MSLRIGAYKAGNNPITRFQKSDNIERLFKIADKNIGFLPRNKWAGRQCRPDLQNPA